MYRAIGYCKKCKYLVYKIYRFGRPTFVITDTGIFHKHHYAELLENEQNKNNKLRIKYETPSTPLGKLTIEKEF